MSTPNPTSATPRARRVLIAALALLWLVGVVAVERTLGAADEATSAQSAELFRGVLWDLDPDGARTVAAVVVAAGLFRQLTCTADTGEVLASTPPPATSATDRLLRSVGLRRVRRIHRDVLRDGRVIGVVSGEASDDRPIIYLAVALVLGLVAILAAARLEELARQRELDRLSVGQERSQRLAAERRLDEREQQLLEVRRMEALGKLAGGIAHDFNNLLTIILGGADLLREEVTPEQSAELEAISDAAERAAAMTRQLLAFSSRQPREPRPVNVGDILRSMGTMLERLLPDPISLALDIADGLPPVKADPAQIEQVLLNLVVNARDAMGEGGTITIAVRPDGEQLRVEVADQGAGMDEETVRRVFEPFFTTKSRGTGLGLSTVYGIVKQTGGTVDVRSAPGQGTTFSISLPTCRGEQASRLDLPALTTAVPGGLVLIVADDEPVVRRLIARILRSTGAEVHEASGPPEALAIAAGLPRLDALVTDLRMKDGDGRTLAVDLRTRRPGLPVLVVSGTGAEGADMPEDLALLTKPFTAEALRTAVARLLPQSPTASASSPAVDPEGPA